MEAPPKDHIFQFELGDTDLTISSSRYPLVEMIKEQLENLMEIIVLTKDGQEVEVDGFKLACDDHTIYRLR